jgi:hypothetical protein
MISPDPKSQNTGIRCSTNDLYVKTSHSLIYPAQRRQITQQKHASKLPAIQPTLFYIISPELLDPYSIKNKCPLFSPIISFSCVAQFSQNWICFLFLCFWFMSFCVVQAMSILIKLMSRCSLIVHGLLSFGLCLSSGTN